MSDKRAYTTSEKNVVVAFGDTTADFKGGSYETSDPKVIEVLDRLADTEKNPVSRAEKKDA